MPYSVPKPTVTQILVNASQDLSGAQLLPVLVGPLYRVITQKQIDATIPGSLPVTYSYPYLDPGSTVDTSSVKLYVLNGRAQYYQYTMTSGNPIFVAGTNSIDVSAADFTTLGIMPNDIVVVDNNGGTYVVQSANGSILTFTSNILYTVPQAGQKFTIYRNYTSVELTSGFSASSSGITVTAVADANAKTFTSGTIAASYRALRTDKTGFYSVDNLETLKADMEISSQNLLGYTLAEVMIPASGNTQVLAYITEDATPASFTIAYSDLATRQDTYLIVPLSTDSTILNNTATHVTTMSQPSISYFRAAILNATLSVTKVVDTVVVTAP